MRRRIALVIMVASFVATSSLFAPPLPVAGPTLYTYRIAGTPPVIDGAYGATEWPWSPQITIDANYRAAQFPSQLPTAPAFATFAMTASDLYILVDLPGDTTATSNDECLFVFGGSPSNFAVNITGTSTDSLGGDRAIGFGTSPNSATPHRIYEFRVPLSVIGAVAGQTVTLASPFWKSSFSMGFDGATGHDNIWPPNLDGTNPSDHSTWASLVLQDPSNIPAVSDLGLFGIVMALALLGFVALRKV